MGTHFFFFSFFFKIVTIKMALLIKVSLNQDLILYVLTVRNNFMRNACGSHNAIKHLKQCIMEIDVTFHNQYLILREAYAYRLYQYL